MLDATNPNLSFKTKAEVEAFASWYLDATFAETKDEYEGNDSQWIDFLARRERRLKVQLDDLLNLTFESAIPCPIEKVSYFKIVKEAHKSKPLSSIGSDYASSRFNYRKSEALKNRTIYFGQDKLCCYAEIFHLDIQKGYYDKFIGRSDEQKLEELPLAKHMIFEFEVEVDKVLVLTGSPAHKALGIPVNIVADEWFPINDEYEIPTAGQILAAVVKKQGYKGILYASVRNQLKNNLVLFEENTGELAFKKLSELPLDHSNFR